MDTPRFALPLIDAGQAQKEIVHNEALALIDLALHASVVAVGMNAPPADPKPGQAWVAGAAPTGAWAGHPRAIAGWTTGGWRFVAPRPGLSAWSIADQAVARCDGSGWDLESIVPPIPDPLGGAVIDVEARAALTLLLAGLRERRIVAGI
ncbi:MAG TPA: DUF2793 domain-containing protein [Sphingomonas sp.]